MNNITRRCKKQRVFF